MSRFSGTSLFTVAPNSSNRKFMRFWCLLLKNIQSIDGRHHSNQRIDILAPQTEIGIHIRLHLWPFPWSPAFDPATRHTSSALTKVQTAAPIKTEWVPLWRGLCNRLRTKSSQKLLLCAELLPKIEIDNFFCSHRCLLVGDGGQGRAGVLAPSRPALFRCFSVFLPFRSFDLGPRENIVSYIS